MTPTKWEEPGGRFIDQATGVEKNVTFTGKGIRVCSQDYLLAVAEGDIPNHIPWSKIGYRAASGSGVEVAVSPQLASSEYIFPTVAQTMKIVSSQANDNASGTGARTVLITYLDGSYVEHKVTVTLEGATPVVFAANAFRIQSVRVVTVGSNNAAVGNLSITNNAGDVTYGYVRAGKTRQRQCIWTVPANRELYITQVIFSAANMGSTKYARFTLKATYDDHNLLSLPAEFFHPLHEVALMNNTYFQQLLPPIKLTSRVDLKVTAETNDTAAVLSCELRGWSE